MSTRLVLISLASLLSACAQNVTPRNSDGGSLDAGTDPADAAPRDASPDDAAARDAGILDAGPPRTCAEGCLGLTRCVDGLCQPYPPCSGAGGCPDGSICQRRMCLPADEDLDGDGSVTRDDCDEGDPAVHPGAMEVCDGVDQNCDGSADEGVAPRDCSTACGSGTESCEAGAWAACTATTPSAETCNNVDDDCNGRVDDGLSRGCTTACGSGTETCAAGRWTGCTAATPTTETCNNVDDDCDGSTDEMLTRACSTACGSGNETCRAGSYGSCDAPPVITESCNLLDDDCNGTCDDVSGGCRIGVHRSLSTSTGEHFYTTSRPEAACCSYTVEFYDYYYLYRSDNSRVVPFYRCLLANGFHFYTRSATCEGSAGARMEGIMGYIGTSASCGSVPLYRLLRGNDHFFTTSAAERDSAVASGYRLESTAGYVWTRP